MKVEGKFPKGRKVKTMEVEPNLGTFVLRGKDGGILATGQLGGKSDG